MKISEFIDYIISFENIDGILNICINNSVKGFIFERLFDVIIKFGFCDIFPNNNYYHLIGNSNFAKLQILDNIYQYMDTKVISASSAGCSDIILQNKYDETFIFISSKYLKDNKRINYYDIQNIVSMIASNNDIYKKYKIYLLVSDKKQVLKIFNNARKSSKYITEHITERQILDKTDLNEYFLRFKKSIIDNKNNNFNEIYLNQKEKLNLRFHQELITQKTNILIEKNKKSFLWGCKCRSGKTYMVGGIILKQLTIKKKLNVLIITPAPTETISQFTKDLFNKYQDFNKFKIHQINGSKNLELLNVSKEENNIFIMSKQLLQKYINDNVIIKIINLDIIFFDENHFSGTTDISKDIIKTYANVNTIKIYLTATYYKPLKEWFIEPECQMFWDIEDEQICKSIINDDNNLVKLNEKHGEEYVLNTIKYYSELGYKNIFDCYKSMPDLYLITNMFDEQRYNIIKEALNINNKMGFCFDTLFSLNKDKNKFNFENEVKIILRYISSSYKEFDGDKTIFCRINKLCAEKDTRHPFTQIWFLPSDNINEISKCLEQLMIQDLILKKYDIICINRKNKDLAKDIKEDINKKEIEAKNKGKTGVIILAGNMLSLGITLNLCDLVILLNNSLSSDKVLQQMYRCMTEAENKKIGFVVDLNISRVLNTCCNYTRQQNIEDKIKYLITHNLINIDVDMLLNKNISQEVIIAKLLEVWKNDPINSFRSLLNKLDNDYENFDNDTQKLLNKTFTKSTKDNIIYSRLIFHDDVQILPSGKECIIDYKNDEDGNEEDKKEENNNENNKEIQISFSKDVLPYIIPLTCILTIKDTNMDFVKMLNDIKNNPQLLETFNDQCLLWWNKTNLIDFIKSIVSKYYINAINTRNVLVQFKTSLHSLIDRPKELLELINDCLKPKEVEKKENGEVFTPVNLINDMLNKLPIEVWTNINFKWLDPCCGMGNFPIVIYLRLMETLKNIIIDEKARKKHILENMLYMIELNKKNFMVCKQIFDINNEYKLNIYQGDSLKINYKTIFNVEHFDIVIGNPPYNASGTKASGNTLWQSFVDISINLLKNNGYLCFVHPNGWRKPNTTKGKFYGLFKKMTSDNTMLYLEIHDTKDGMKQFQCGTRYDWYVLQKRINNDYKTLILDQDKILLAINLLKYNWLANCELELIDSLLAINNEERCQIMQSMSAYEPRKKWMSKTKNDIFKYPVIHATTQNGPRFMWSNRNDNGHYGIKKIIFGDSGINNPIIDIKGEYAMTQHAMAIIIDNDNEGQKISKILCSQIFNKILKACLWSSFAIEWCMFKYFKKNFYDILENIENDNKIKINNEPKIIDKTETNNKINNKTNNKINNEINKINNKTNNKTKIINKTKMNNKINDKTNNKTNDKIVSN
ncbi:restriction-modification methylase [Hokovirus HKV1]|uniref:Restriction-modification methylase n=1 Tax=Hokovirus HKV1 TaxID=1977638 RepID=A0A1V0SF44_9VIRU|nr:restriction-modification methylase [Hokovirus HKV1]